MNAMNKMIRMAVGAAILLGAAGAHAADVTVKVDGVPEPKGSVRIMLFDAASWLREPIREAGTPAVQGATSVTLKDVAPGDYVYVVYLDANGNGKLDMDPQGVPTEPFAVSREPAMENGPPSFDNAKFTQTNGGSSSSVKLINLR